MSNVEGISKLLDIMDKNFEGLCFTNLTDFDRFNEIAKCELSDGYFFQNYM